MPIKKVLQTSKIPFWVPLPKNFSKGESVRISVLINVISSSTGYKLLSIEENKLENNSLIVSKITWVTFAVPSNIPHPNYIKLLMAAKMKSVAPSGI